jgi:hypothetical protein
MNANIGWIKAVLDLPDTHARYSDPTRLLHFMTRLMRTNTMAEYLGNRDDIDYSMRDYHVALDSKRHDKDDGMDEFKHMCDAQLVTDALLSTRYVRKDNIITEMEMRQEAKTEQDKIEWFKTQDLQDILLNKKEHHVDLALLIGSYPAFETWVRNKYMNLKLDVEDNESVLSSVMEVMQNIQLM